MTPLLSLVTCARNDNYNGDFLYRLETAINYTSQELEKSGRLGTLELIIVDWGSEKPLYMVLNLTPTSIRLVRFIIVPPDIATHYNGNATFSGALAINVGIRRSRAEYIGQTGGDIVHTNAFFDHLFHMIQDGVKFSPKTLFVIPAKDIPRDIVDAKPDIEDLGKYISSHIEALPLRPIMPVLMGSAGILLMHKNLWGESRGLDENLKLWGWSDIDLIMRLGLKYIVLNTAETNPQLYVLHLQHPYASVTEMSPMVTNPFTVNGANWGLADLSLEEYPPVVHQEICIHDAESPSLNNKTYHIRYLIKFFKACMSSRDIATFREAKGALTLVLKNYIKYLFGFYNR